MEIPVDGVQSCVQGLDFKCAFSVRYRRGCRQPRRRSRGTTTKRRGASSGIRTIFLTASMLPLAFRRRTGRPLATRPETLRAAVTELPHDQALIPDLLGRDTFRKGASSPPAVPAILNQPRGIWCAYWVGAPSVVRKINGVETNFKQ